MLLTITIVVLILAAAAGVEWAVRSQGAELDIARKLLREAEAKVAELTRNYRRHLKAEEKLEAAEKRIESLLAEFENYRDCCRRQCQKEEALKAELAGCRDAADTERQSLTVEVAKLKEEVHGLVFDARNANAAAELLRSEVQAVHERHQSGRQALLKINTLAVEAVKG